MATTKELNLALLQSTKDDCDLYTLLSKGVAYTREHQSGIRNEELTELPDSFDDTPVNVLVSDEDSFTAASHYRGKKTAVVNLGSARIGGSM